MKPLIFVKHSLPEIVEDVPAREWNLSDVGRLRAQRLADELIRYHPDVIFSSPEPKAIQTAEIVAETFSLSFQQIEGLHEHDRSNAPFCTPEEFQKLVREFFVQPDTLVFGAETAVQALSRFRQAVDGVLDLSENKTTTIVSHGTVISLYTAWLTGCNGYDLWQKLGLPSFVTLDVQSKRLLETINLR